MRTGILLFAALSLHAQTQTDAEFCAKVVKSNETSLKNGGSVFRPPDECYLPTQFGFVNKPTPQGMNEVLTILRTTLDLTRVSADAGAGTVSVQGNPDKLAMAAWLIQELDQPVKARPDLRMDQYPIPASVTAGPTGTPGRNEEVIDVFFLAHTKTFRGIQELLTTLRMVGEVQKVFNNTAQTAMIARGSVAQMALAAQVINALDVEKAPAAPIPDFKYGTDSVRVFYLEHATTPQAVSQIMRTIWDVAGIKKAFGMTAPAAITVRGSVDDLAAAARVVRAVDAQ